MSQFDEAALQLHREKHGKLEVSLKVPLNDRADLSLAYTPGVGAISRALAADPSLMYELTPKGNMVAVVSDGSAVLGLGNIGPAGAYPVMEGKAALFKRFGGVDAFPLVLGTQKVDEIVDLVCNVAEGFGGINLEDIAAPRCFEIEEKLKARLKIPVFHDDQHGTAIVVLAGLLNALKVVKKDKNVNIVMNGAGAAGIATAKLLVHSGFKKLVMIDSEGAIYQGRPTNMNPAKEEMAGLTNPEKRSGSLAEMLVGADVFIGVSKANVVSQDMVRSMSPGPIVIAMANPDPEITEADALAAGAAVVATGRSDSQNQLNNVLVFPGIFRGILDARLPQFEYSMFVRAAQALADLVPHPSAQKILPTPFEEGVVEAVAKAVKA